MAHNLDESTGRFAIAFRGSRDAIWHRHGQQYQPGWTMDDWRREACLDWECRMVPAFADLSSLGFHGSMHSMKVADGHKFMVRTDNGAILGHASDRYQPVQPKQLFDWFEQYIGVDDRFQLDAAGALKNGAVIWATATYNGAIDVVGDAHVARLLMTTTYDGTGATINRATMTRVVCNNTLNAAMSDHEKALVRTRHNTTFSKDAVGQQLAGVIAQFARYKAMGEAMACVHMANRDVSALFKKLLDIPADATSKDDVSKRKMDQFELLTSAYSHTIRNEGREPERAWTALQAITRYVDHNKGQGKTSSKSDRENGEARFLSANFGGSGELMKRRGLDFLLDMNGGELRRLMASKSEPVKMLAAPAGWDVAG